MSKRRTLKSRGTTASHMKRRPQMSASHKYIKRDKPGAPKNNASNSYNFTSSAHKRKRIYSAKPNLQESRKFTKITNKHIDPYIMQMSPSEKKIKDSFYINFSSQTAAMTDFQRSFYNPYQTTTKFSDNI